MTGPRVLLTGGTGRLGRCLARELLGSGCHVVLLVRAGSPRAAHERVRGVLPDVELSHLTALCGDTTQPGLGLGARDRARLLSSVEFVVHAAATTSFTAPLAAARAANVAATRNVLTFAERVRSLSAVVHVSTAFVAGKRTGRILEIELEHDRGFQNTYQRSKYEAEHVVRSYQDRVPTTVVRPSIVLDGPEAPQRSAFRYAFELVRRGLLPGVPGTGATPVDLVTEEDAARAIVCIALAPDARGTYHVAGGDSAPTLGAIVEPYATGFLEPDQFAWASAKWGHMRPRLAGVYQELASFIYELAYPKVFDTSRAEAVLGGPVTTEDPLASLHGETLERPRLRAGVRAT